MNKNEGMLERADITHSVMAVLRKDFIGFTRLPCSSMGVTAASVALPSGANTGPMGSAMIYKNMPEVGGRGDLGIMPIWNARYLNRVQFGKHSFLRAGFLSMG